MSNIEDFQAVDRDGDSLRVQLGSESVVLSVRNGQETTLVALRPAAVAGLIASLQAMLQELQ